MANAGKVIAVLVVILVIGVGVYAYQSGIISQIVNPSPGGLSFSSSTGSKTQCTNYVSSSTVFDDYSSNAALAAQKYSGSTCISGFVDNVEQDSNGNYRSCISGHVYGCGIIEYVGGYVVWNWQSQRAAAAVVPGEFFVATCSVVGIQGGNLVLNNCLVVRYPQATSSTSASVTSPTTSEVAMWKGYISPVNFYAKYFNSSAYGTTFNCTSDVHTSYPPSFVGVFVVNQGSNSVTVKFLTLSTSGENATMHPDGSCTAAGVAVLVLQFEGVPHLPIEPSVGDTFVLTVYFTNGLKAALTYQFE